MVISFALPQGFGLSPLVFRAGPGVGALVLVAGNAVSYSKAYIMYSFVPIVWVCLVDRRARRWLPALGVSIGVLYLFIIAPVVMQARSQALLETESPMHRLAETFADLA